MHILSLTLKKKWFDMILSGQKTEEYRDIKPYWGKRFNKFIHKKMNENMYVKFTNGYGNHRPSFLIELNMFTVGTGKPEWGAEKDKEYYILKLGKIISN
jgi:hypothetical protein